MQTAKEISKIKAIYESGKFVYRGITYNLDVQLTDSHQLNANLMDKPLRRFVGVDSRGRSVGVWSHDVEAVEPTHAVEINLDAANGTIEEFIEEMAKEPLGEPEPVKKKKNKKNKH